jgi:hypothetical protein
MRRPAAGLFILPAILWAAEPRKSAAEYPAHADARAASLGAEMTGRFILQDGGSHHTGDYLAVEIGYFPKKDAPVEVRGSDFMLAVNGSTQLVYPQTASLVAGAIRHPEWESRPAVQLGAGSGAGGIVLGPPRQQPRFPGDPTVRTPQRVPTEPGKQGVTDPSKDPLEMAAAAVTAAAFPEGPAAGQRTGYLYFSYRKKLTAIKKLELIWISGQERRILTLR